MPIDDPAVASAGDAPAATADRPLRDYDQWFHASFVQRSLLSDAIAKLNSNILRMEAALKSTGDEVGFRQSEIEHLTADLERFQHERNVIAAYGQTLERLLTTVRDRLKATYVHNRQLASQWTAEQLGQIRANAQ
jgi:chromosome segregation ATPase